MTIGAFRRASFRLQVASRATSGGSRMPYFFERKTCVAAVVLMAWSALAGFIARVVALLTIHVHMRVVRERHLAEAC